MIPRSGSSPHPLPWPPILRYAARMADGRVAEGIAEARDWVRTGRESAEAGFYERAYGAAARACLVACDVLCVQRIGVPVSQHHDEMILDMVAAADTMAATLLEPVLGVASSFVVALTPGTPLLYPEDDDWAVTDDEARTTLRDAGKFVDHVAGLLKQG